MLVVVTGGAGFLGQHIVKLLHQSEFCTGIRVLDCVKYQQRLDFVPCKSVDVVVGDICNAGDVREALQDVQVVIHTASIVDTSMFPDLQRLNWVNVRGTQNVISACQHCGVERLVYTSTVDVVIGYSDINHGEESIVPPDQLLWQGYAHTKLQAENLVCAADGIKLDNGGVLKTVAVRPNLMYGELDPFFIPAVLAAAKQSFGVLPRIGNGKLQVCYVGNMAWAHIKAVESLADNPAARGRVFFIPDDTPVKNSPDFLQPFLNTRGYTVSSFRIPYFLLFTILSLFQICLRILHPVCKVNPRDITLKSVKQLQMNVQFTRTRAEQTLGYKPIYTFQEACTASVAYYQNCEI